MLSQELWPGITHRTTFLHPSFDAFHRSAPTGTVFASPYTGPKDGVDMIPPTRPNPSSTPEFDDVIGELYEAALNTASLPVALEKMTQWLDGDTCHLFGLDRSTGRPLLSASYGLDQEIGPSYANHFAAIDPRRKLALTLPAGGLIACHEHFSARDVSRSEFYQDYLMPLGLHYLLGSGDLTNDERVSMQIGFQRRLGRTPFETEASLGMKRLMPHLQRALTLMLRTDAWRAALVSGTQGLDALDAGVVAIDDGGRIVWANLRAQTTFRDGTVLRAKHGRLVAPSATAQSQLEAALKDVAATGEPKSVQMLAGSDPRSNAADRAAMQAPATCCLTIVRLSDAATDLSDGIRGITQLPRARLLVFITTAPSQGRLKPPAFAQGEQARSVQDQRRQAYMAHRDQGKHAHEALSERELQVLRLIARGCRHAEVARLLGLTISTVRTHLRNIYAKLGVHGNTEAVFEAGALGLLS